MSRIAMPLHLEDISAFARSLRSQLLESEAVPSHLSLMNMLARSGGFRNFQHFRANAEACAQIAPPVQAAPSVDFVLVRRLARYFDQQGMLTRWPAKFSHREHCLWVLWSRMDPRAVFTETQMNHFLGEHHTFGDPALLRRWMADTGMVERSRDCREYRRLEKRPSPEALVLIRHLRSQAAGGPSEAGRCEAVGA